MREAERKKNEKVTITIDMIKKSWFIPKYAPLLPKQSEIKSEQVEKTEIKEVDAVEDEEEQIEDEERGEESLPVAEKDAEGDDEQDSESEPTSPSKDITDRLELDANETEIVDVGPIEPTQEEIYALKVMHLEFKNISEISGLENFTKLESLYLQHNRITEIQCLDNLQNLEFLALQNNLIKELKGLKQWVNLAFLNISYNKIKEFDIGELPKNLFILKLRNNPWEKSMPNLRKSIVIHWELLEDLDGVSVNIAERMHYQGIVEIDLDSQLSQIKDRKIEEEMK